MGLPMVQVFMIIARQMSKPVADLVMRYGKDHPLFRNKILVPVGRGLANLSTRLRMKNLGLGSPKDIKQISENSALEQASEFVQQVVIFGYTVSVFYIYTVYSKTMEKPTVTPEDLNGLREDFNRQIQRLNEQIQSLETQLNKKNNSSWNIFRWFSSDTSTKEICPPPKPTPIPNISNNISSSNKTIPSSSLPSKPLERNISIQLPEFTSSISREEAMNLITTFEMAEANE